MYCQDDNHVVGERQEMAAYWRGRLVCLQMLLATALLSVLFCLMTLAGIAQAAERVALKAADGFPLIGLYEQAGAGTAGPAVVLLHMYNNRKESWQPLIAELRNQGVSALAIDLRGHGESRLSAAGIDQAPRVENRDASFFNEMYQDAAAAVQWLKGRGHHSIGVVGASVGCSVAMHMAVATKTDIGAMVLMTPGLDYLGIDTLHHLGRWPGLPLLILTSEEEKDRGATTIYQHLENQGARLIVLDQRNIHGTRMFGVVTGVEERISGWLRQWLR